MAAPTDQSSPPAAPAPAGALLRFPCKQCGAKLEFAPGTDHLLCPYCGTANEIGEQVALQKGESTGVEERDLLEAFKNLEAKEPHDNADTVHCDACNADFTVATTVTSSTCPFCSSNIVSKAKESSILRPGAILPFSLTREKATQSYRAWLGSRWFAPSALKSRGLLDGNLSGIYLPHWTYDALTTTQYEGQRGEAYYETQYVTINGRRTAQQVRKIRWYPASGSVRVGFDDILVPASHSLNTEQVRELTPWDLQDCVPYRAEYLAGFRAETYQVPLDRGFLEAKQRMEPMIDATIRRDIGGDEQRITRKRTTYADLTFKHVLLPIWLSAFRYNGKVFQFMINARTAEVQGQRPYSVWKIVFAVLGGLIVLGVVIALVSMGNR